MANPTPYQSIIDIDGLREQIRLTKADIEDWVSNAKALLQSLFQESEKVKNSLGGIKFNVGGASGNQLTDYAGQVQDLTTKLNFQRQAMDGITTTERRLAEVQQSLTQRTEELLTRYSELNGTSAKVVAEKKRIAAELANLQGQFDRLSKSVKTTTGNTKEITGQYNKLQQELAEARKALKALDNAFDSNTGAINKNNAEAVRLSELIRTNDTLLRKFDQTLGLHNRNIGNYPKNLQGVTASLSDLLFRYISIDAAFSAAKGFVVLTAEMEQLDSRLQAVSRSSEDFKQSQQFLLDLADEMGLRYDSLVKSYSLLKAATKDTSLEGSTTEKIFRAVAQSAAKLKLSTDEAEGTLTALTQMISKGKVSAEELRQQLGDRLPGALRIMADAVGVDTVELDKMMEKGQLMAVDVLPKFADQLQKTFGGTARQDIHNMTSEWNRLVNEAQQLVAAFNENQKVSNFFGTIAAGIAGVFRDLKELVKSDEWGLFFQYLTGNVAPGRTAAQLNRQADAAIAKRNQEFKAKSPEERQRLVNEAKQKELALERQLSMLVNADPTPEVLDKETKLQKELNRAKAQYNALSKLNTEQIQEEQRIAIAKDKEAAQAAKLRAEEEEKERKKAQQAAEQRRRRAQAGLESSLRTVSSNTSTNVSNLTSQKESGEMSESDYLVAKYNETVAGITKRRALLNKAYQDQIIDKQKFNEEIAKLNKETADAGTDYLKGQSKAQEDAFNKLMASAKAALQQTTEGNKSKLEEQIGDLENAYTQAQGDIERKVKSRQLTEAEGEQALHDLKLKLIYDIRNAVVESSGKEEEAIKETSKTLTDAAKTDEQTTAVSNLSKVEMAQNLAFILKKIKKSEADEYAEQERHKTKITDEEEAKRLAIIQASLDLITNSVSGFFDLQTSLRNNDLAILDKQKQAELDAAKNNDAQKAIIEKRYEQRQRDIRRRQAQADKAAAIFQIVLSSALAIGKTFAQFGFPAGVPLAALQAALMAAQTALIIARPLPEFFRGSQDAPEGPAWVGERGFEIIQSKDKSGKPIYRLAAEKQITYLNRHDKVFTHEESKKMIRVNEGYAQDMRKSSPRYSGYAQPIPKMLSAEQIEQAMINAVSRIPVIEEHKDESGYRRYIRTENQRVQEMNDYFSLPKKKS